MRRYNKKLNMVKANSLAESRYLGTKGVINEGIQKTDSDELAKDIIKGSKDESDENALIVKSAQGDEDIQRRLTDRVSRLKLNEEEVYSDDYFSKYNTTMQEQKEICWNMIKHFKSIDKAIAENEKMMKDKIMRAKEAKAAGDIEEANDYMESIKLFQFRIQYMNNNRDMLSLSLNPFFNK
jgi:hypothetical protein